MLSSEKALGPDAVGSVVEIDSGMSLEGGEAGLLNDEFGSSLNERAKPGSRDMPQSNADVMDGIYPVRAKWASRKYLSSSRRELASGKMKAQC